MNRNSLVNLKVRLRAGALFCLLGATCGCAQFMREEHKAYSGPWRAARVQSFTREGPMAYTLVLIPRPPVHNGDDYMRDCETFTIHGDFKPLSKVDVNPYPSGPSPKKRWHVKALEYIEQASRANAEIEFDGQVHGFERVHRNNPCEVESRALALDRDGDDVSVVSFFAY